MLRESSTYLGAILFCVFFSLEGCDVETKEDVDRMVSSWLALAFGFTFPPLLFLYIAWKECGKGRKKKTDKFITAGLSMFGLLSIIMWVLYVGFAASKTCERLYALEPQSCPVQEWIRPLPPGFSAEECCSTAQVKSTTEIDAINTTMTTSTTSAWCPLGLFGDSCEKHVAVFNDSKLCLEEYVDAPLCEGLIYASADSSLCSSSCNAWKRIFEATAVMYEAELGDLMVDAVGLAYAIVLGFYFWRKGEEAVAKIRSILILCMLGNFLADFVLEVTVVASVSEARVFMDQVKNGFCFSQGDGYDTIVKLAEAVDWVSRFAVLNVVLAVVGAACDLGQGFSELKDRESLTLTTQVFTGIAALAEFVIGFVSFLANTIELKTGLEAMQKAALGLHDLEQGFACFVRHPDLPRIEAPMIGTSGPFWLIAFPAILVALSFSMVVPCMYRGYLARIAQEEKDKRVRTAQAKQEREDTEKKEKEDREHQLEERTDEVNDLSGKLTNAEADLVKERKKVEQKEEELQKAKADLVNERKKVEHKEGELQKAKADLVKERTKVEQKEGELQKAKADLVNERKQVEQKEEELQKAKADLVKERTKVEQKEGELQKAKADLVKERTKVEQKEGELETMKKARRAAEDKLSTKDVAISLVDDNALRR
ncbi:unnamed protein product [Durusdinium trenchii]|uniref:Uncharacterized protein n=1 Tax=Durusdinium trenchii TaxID=1381693 RepID=A0ABP0KKF0_9DINO